MSKNKCPKNTNISLFSFLCSKMDIFIMQQECKYAFENNVQNKNLEKKCPKMSWSRYRI